MVDSATIAADDTTEPPDRPAPPQRLDSGSFLSSGSPPAPATDESSPSRTLSCWLTARTTAGQGSIVLAPFMIAAIVVRAMLAAGSGLLAPTVLLVGQLVLAMWDRTYGRRPTSATG
jgi:hypothetical protein